MAAFPPGNIDELIERACNGDWRIAEQLLRGAGLMPAPEERPKATTTRKSGHARGVAATP